MALARWQAHIVDEAGNVLPNALITVVHETVGNPPASLYEDRDGVSPLGSSTNADGDGYAFFHAAAGAYKITATLGAQTREWRYVALGTASEFDFTTGVDGYHVQYDGTNGLARSLYLHENANGIAIGFAAAVAVFGVMGGSGTGIANIGQIGGSNSISAIDFSTTTGRHPTNATYNIAGGDGHTYINATTGNSIYQRINNADVGTWSVNGLYVRCGIAVGGTAGNSQINAEISGNAANGANLRFHLYRTSNGSDHNTVEHRIQRRIDSTDMGYIGFGSTYLALGGNTSETMRIDQGNVLIGTTSSITANSIFEVDWSTNGNHYLLVRNANTGGSARVGLQMASDNHAVAGALWVNGSATVDYAGANSLNMSTVPDAPIGIVTNNTLRALIHSWGADSTYGMLTFNGVRTAAGGIGLVGKPGGGDNNFYYMVPTGGGHTFRVNNADAAFISASGMAINAGLRVGFTGTPSDDTVAVGDANCYFTYNSGTPLINFDANDYCAYGRGSNLWQWVIGGSAVAQLGGVNVGLSLGTATANTINTGFGFKEVSYSAGTMSGGGTYTPDATNSNKQHITNGGAFTLAPPSASSTIEIEITNNGSAGTITTSGFTKVIGDAFTTTNGHKFACLVSKTQTYSYMIVSALQ